MEPAARTVASGPEWSMRAGGKRARTDSLWAPAGRQWPHRHQIGPYRGGGRARDCVLQRAQPGAAGRASGLAPWYIYRGVGGRRAPVRFPMPLGVWVE